VAYVITKKCIVSEFCVPECPEDAITAGDLAYIIDPDSCTDCGDCTEICPVEACVPEE
jgi:NAD-dependent dihydropyrimidine dehydrogenase PreA subunit